MGIRFPKALSCVTPCAAIFLTILFTAAHAGEPSADFSFKLQPGQISKYFWSNETTTEMTGREKGETFTLKSELKLDLTVLIQGVLQQEPGMGLSVKIPAYAKTEKQSVGAEVTETREGNGKVKVIQNGKPIVDSDNDIGLEEIKGFQDFNKKMQGGEMRVTLDPAGKPVKDAEGEPLVVDTVKASGVEGMMRLLPGRELKPGESWEDSQLLPYLASFKLAKPVAARSKSTFTAWETKYGKRVARIDVVTTWDKNDLKGENEEGMTVEISGVQGSNTGVVYFDPTNGQFVEGEIELTSKYRMDGKAKDGQSTGLDVKTKSKYSFKQIP